ncbi:hypothetical protein [Microcoleus sp. herbarium12]
MQDKQKIYDRQTTIKTCWLMVAHVTIRMPEVIGDSQPWGRIEINRVI